MKSPKIIFRRRRKYRSLWEEIDAFVRISATALSLSLAVCGFLVPISTAMHLLLAAQLGLTAAVVLKSMPLRVRLSLAALSIIVAVFSIQERQKTLESNRAVSLTRLPMTSSFSWPNLMIKEEDGIYLAFRLLSLIGGITRQEYEGFEDAVIREYALMRSAYGDFPTPLGSTFLFMENPSGFDLLSFSPGKESGRNEREKKAVVFLHGVGGNWTLLCWIISQAAASSGFSTFCPSKGPLGTWGKESGEKIFAETLDRLKSLGFKKIYLAGISAGAVGAVPLANRYSESLSGLILISGAGPGLGKTTLKTLLITGTQDERFTPQIMEWLLRYEGGANPLVEHHRVEGDHLALIKKKEEIKGLILDWLSIPSAINNAPRQGPSPDGIARAPARDEHGRVEARPNNK